MKKRRKKINPLASMKKTIDKSINALEKNSLEIDAVLPMIKEVDKSSITESDKLELAKLMKELDYLDSVINKIVEG